MIHYSKKLCSLQTLLCASFVAFAITNASAATRIDDVKVQVTATASKSNVGVADPFNVVIEAVAPEGVVVRFPEVSGNVGDFEVINHRDTLDIPNPSGRRYQRLLTLETLKTGELNVPKFKIFYKDNRNTASENVMMSVQTAAIPIAVKSSITDAESPNEFRDIKDVVFLDEPSTARSTQWVFLATVGGLGIVGIVGLIVLSRWKERLSPMHTALRTLDQLRDSGSFTSRDSTLVYEKAAEALRTFIETQFDFPATRQTTDEFLVAVKSDQRLSEQLQQQLKQFLESADLVKFAGLSCSPEMLMSAIDNARRFVLDADEQRIAAAKRPDDKKVTATPLVENTPSVVVEQIENVHGSSSLQKETL